MSDPSGHVSHGDAVPTYPQLLHAAYELGRTDGFLAADLEPLHSPDPPTSCCRGRGDAAFARLLWGAPVGCPPAGLVTNAAHWYRQGFGEALAEARCSPRPATGPLTATTSDGGLRG